MAVFRVEKTKDYTVMSNHHLKNKGLSLKAKGLLSQMLSLPENWDYTLKGLSIINKESVDAIREAVKELEGEGYVIRTRKRNEKGQLTGTDYTIFEKPYKEKIDETTSNKDFATLDKPILENPRLDKPIQDEPLLENPRQLNTKETNIDLLNKKGGGITNPSIPYQSIYKSDEKDEIESATTILKNQIKENIEYHFMVDRFRKDRLDDIVDIMVETLSSKREYITVAGDEYPASLVKERLERINSSHIEYIFDCLDKNTSYVRNIKKYLLTTLFNAPSTMDSYYAALVNHDLYGDDSRW